MPDGYGLFFKQLNSKAGKLLNHLTLFTFDERLVEIGNPIDEEDEESKVIKTVFD